MAELAFGQEIFGCQIAPFPCHYLGVPLSIYKLEHSKEQPLVDMIVDRIPTWKGNKLNLAGRATLVKVTHSAIPIFISSATCLSVWAIEQIDLSPY